MEHLQGGHLRPEPLAVAVSKRILEYLLSGAVELGSRIPSERELAKTLGVGRSAIRDGIKPLMLLGLLESRPGDGTYLLRRDSELLPNIVEWGLLLGEQHVQELIEARRYIEASLAQLAAQRRDAGDIARLRSCLNAMRDASSYEHFVEADTSFHLAVAEASHNHVLAGILTKIKALLGVWIRRVVEAAGETNSSYVEHVPIFEAVERGDSEAAAEAMTKHLEAASARLERTLARASGEVEVA